MICRFIDDHRDRFGVQPICRVLTEHHRPIAGENLLRLASAPAIETGLV